MLLDALNGLRVVELSEGVPASYAGRLLAEFGAAVTKVVASASADGAEQRARHPLRDAYFNAAKATVTIDLAGDGEALRALVDAADVVIEDMGPGAMDRCCPSWETVYPELIVLSVSPFGQSGPNADRTSYPLVDLHAGGEGWELVQVVSEDAERRPIRPPAMTGGDTGGAFCGLTGAIGVLAALYRRRTTGRGNHIDLSAQEAALWPARVELSGFVNEGITGRRRTRERIPGGVLPAADGWVEIMPFEDRMWDGLIEAMGRPEWADDPRWHDRQTRLGSADELVPRLAEFTRNHPAARLRDLAQAHGCPASEVASMKDLAESEQFRARGFFVQVDWPNIGPVSLPSTPFGGPKPTYAAEPVGGGGKGATGSVPARPEHPMDRSARRVDPGFLGGTRVLDLTFNRAGPSCTALMAALGAEVIRVESRHRIDSNRLPRPGVGAAGAAAPDPDPDAPERRSGFGSINMGKKGILLNLQAPGAVPVVKRLVERCDVVVESFTPGVIEAYGIGYEALRSWNAGIVLVSVSGFGRGGPFEHFRAYADIFAAAGGLQGITGHPEEPPMPFVGRLDSVVGCYAALGALAALLERDVSGLGQHVDVSAAEAVACLLGTPLMEFLVDGSVATRSGNRVPDMAPHNCYRCADPDDWLVVAVATDSEWKALCTAMGQPVLADDPCFSTLSSRKAHETALDRAIGAWSADLVASDAATQLQIAGVAATASMSPQLLFEDPHLAARDAWVQFTHPVQGARIDVGLPWRFSDGLATYGPAPLLGQHDTEVYAGLLGMSDQEIAALRLQGVLA